MKNLKSIVGGLVLFSVLTGCGTIYNSDKITVVKTHCFGLMVETSATSGNGTPSVKLGFISQVVQIIPTATNTLYAAPMVDIFNIDTTGNPLDVSINEDSGFGKFSYTTNTATTYQIGRAS